MKTNLLFKSALILALMIGLNSCEKPLPTGDFTFEVDGFDVTFTSTVTETTDYAWDFGDGSESTEANPVHSYVVSGTYPVVLTVTGPGGEATATHDVEILPSFDEMLTGGPTDEDGKTWVLSSGYIEGVDGGSGVESSMMIIFGSAENLLIGLEFPDEYDNEFTFKSDGTYTVDNKNGVSLASLMYSLYGGVEGEVVRSAAGDELGLCTKEYTAPENSTWSLHEEDLVVTAAPYGGEDVPANTYDVTFTGYKWIELSQDAYFGILDYPTTRKFIIKSITPESMSVAMLICGYWADPVGSGQYPTLMYHQTFVPKP